ncbi:hypothetical protein ACGF13_34645 [Kitasatospora sp. NPDC048286]|uniref:hypothetical protein n=1 Tax=unclassified Kitasatospora TaxID=2633591 RepID=UPI003717465A
MDDQDQYDRYRADSKVLAAIGARLDTQYPTLTVRLPKDLARAAVAAWDRDELGDVGEETHEQYALRGDAGELALIGLAISERGREEGDEVVVDLHIDSIGLAVQASR